MTSFMEKEGKLLRSLLDMSDMDSKYLVSRKLDSAALQVVDAVELFHKQNHQEIVETIKKYKDDSNYGRL